MKTGMNDRENNILFKRVGRKTIKKIQSLEEIDQRFIDLSWNSVEDKLRKQHIRRKMVFITSIAASFVLILLSIHFYTSTSKETQTGLSVLLLESSYEDDKSEIVLITENKEIELINESSIEYTQAGELSFESVVKENSSDVKEDLKMDDSSLNKIHVPRGRRVNIKLSDGTSIYINSASKVIYPSVFGDKTREILVEGEVYLDVAKDENRPFIVKTRGFEAKVLGTSFNICAYKEDSVASVVLVEGSLMIKTNKESIIIKPNEKLSVKDEEARVCQVNVNDYILWKDYIMLLPNIPTGDVLTRLSRYYGVDISSDNEVKNIPVCGKLDLKDGIEDALEYLSITLDLKYSINSNGSIYVRIK